MPYSLLKFLSFCFCVILLAACGGEAAPTSGGEAPQPAAPSSTFTLAPTSPVEPPATPTPVPPTATPAPTLVYEGEPSVGSYVIGADGMKTLFVPAGEFIMGASANRLLEVCQRFRSDCRRDWFLNVEPERKVSLDAFWIDETEVTNKMYKACMDAGKCAPPFQVNSSRRESYFDSVRYESYPVIYVSWVQAQAYCEFVGRRLPTEAEWEKAARGTDGRLFPWGGNLPTTKYANFGLRAGDTSPVKQYSAGKSPYGAFDMLGNAWEWTADWYEENYYKTAPALNPTGPQTGTLKVLRGGSWVSNDFDMFVTERYGNFPNTTNNIIGFRCARSR